MHQPNHRPREEGLDARQHHVHGRDHPQKLPVGPRLAQLHDQGDGGRAEVDERVDDEGPYQSKAPDVREIVQAALQGLLLGRPEERGPGRRRVVLRRVVGRDSSPNKSHGQRAVGLVLAANILHCVPHRFSGSSRARKVVAMPRRGVAAVPSWELPGFGYSKLVMPTQLLPWHPLLATRTSAKLSRAEHLFCSPTSPHPTNKRANTRIRRSDQLPPAALGRGSERMAATMPVGLLETVLGLYPDVHGPDDTTRLYHDTTALLSHLTNPLNISLLTSHFLTAAAIWQQPDGLQTCLRVVTTVSSAAVIVQQNELENAKGRGPRRGGGLGPDAWARAVAKGADDRSERWKHLLVLAGLLVGLEGEDRQALSRSLRSQLEHAVVVAANLALEKYAQGGRIVAQAITLALSYVFPLLPLGVARGLDCSALLPITVATLTGMDGLGSGEVLVEIEADSRLFNNQLHWPWDSPSSVRFQQLQSRPLVVAAGSLATLAAFAVEHARDSRAVMAAQDVLLSSTSVLHARWSSSSKLSGLDTSMETSSLTQETLGRTWPVLWQYLKKILYSTTVVLQAVLSRSLLDPHMRPDSVASAMAVKSLQILRNLHFISSRQGAKSFQVYLFTYFASIDILARYPATAATFLRSLLPQNPGQPTPPLQATLDLFYLDLAEHFPLVLPPEECDVLIAQPAMRYIMRTDVASGTTATLSPRTVELFEAAHSAVLSVLSSPRNAPVTAGLAPVYAEALFASFPSRISPRQFRFAFQTLMQILSPPFPISATHPLLAEALLEMVRMRASTANTAPLPQSPDDTAKPLPDIVAAPMSEQSALVLTMIDALPFLTLTILEEWMTVAAEAVWVIADGRMREVAKQRFWDVLVSGEMDVERAAIGVAWWGTKGGGELVLHGRLRPSLNPPLMSGAIPREQNASRL